MATAVPAGPPVALGPRRATVDKVPASGHAKTPAKPNAKGKPRARRSVSRPDHASARASADAKREEALLREEGIEEVDAMTAELASLSELRERLLQSNESRAAVLEKAATSCGKLVGAVTPTALGFQERAEATAAILIQSQWRRVLGVCKAATRRQQMQDQESRKGHLAIREVGRRVSCPLDQLSAAVDSVAHVEDRIPFVHATSDDVQKELERILHFAPGFTLRRHVDADMKPDRLREVIISALEAGLTVVIDLDGQGGAAQQEPFLSDICGPGHFPLEMLQRPSAMLEPEVFGPLWGRAGAQAEAYFEALGLDSSATIDEIKAAYRSLAKTSHPDKGGDPELFLKIQSAYEALAFSVQGDVPDTGFVPNPAFKLLLVSREQAAPPCDVAQYCTPIWVSAARSMLLPGQGQKVEAFSCRATSGLGILAEMHQEDAFRYHREFMRERLHEDDGLEAQRRLQESIARTGRRRRRLARRLLSEVVRLRRKKAGPTEYESTWSQLQEMEAQLGEVVCAVQAEEAQAQQRRLSREQDLRAMAAEQLAISQAQAKAGEIERLATGAKSRMERRMAARDARTAALSAKRASVEAGRSPGKTGAKAQQELKEMEAKDVEANALDQQCDALLQQFETEAANLRASLEVKTKTVYASRLRQKQEHTLEDARHLESCTRVWRLTEQFEVEERQLDAEASKSASDDMERLARDEKSRLAQTPFPELHAAVHLKSLGNSSELVNAALEGEISTVTELLAKGFDLESHDAHGFTALSDAACGGHVDIVRLLLSLGADPNTYGTVGTEGTFEYQERTPLYRAVFNGHRCVMELLLQNGAFSFPVQQLLLDSGPKVPEELTRLLQSWTKERSEEAQEARRSVLEDQLDEMSKSWSLEDQRTLYLSRLKARVITLATKGQANQLEELLDKFAIEEAASNPGGLPGLTADVHDNIGRTLLHLAAWKAHGSVVEMLLTRWKIRAAADATAESEMIRKVFRVDINARFGPFNGCSGWTALGIAAFMGHAEVVEILRRHGANPLMGTSFHADVFTMALTFPEAQKSLGKAMEEYVGDTPGKFLCDRRPIPVQRACGTRKQLEGWQLPRKREQLQDALRVDAELNGPNFEEVVPTLVKGSFLRCVAEEIEVYQTASSHATLGKMQLGELAIVEGPVAEHDGYMMVPIKIPTRLKSAQTRRLSRCYVEIDQFETYKTEEVKAKGQRRRAEESCFFRLTAEGRYVPHVDDVED